MKYVTIILYAITTLLDIYLLCWAIKNLNFIILGASILGIVGFLGYLWKFLRKNHIS